MRRHPIARTNVRLALETRGTSKGGGGATDGLWFTSPIANQSPVLVPSANAAVWIPSLMGSAPPLDVVVTRATIFSPPDQCWIRARAAHQSPPRSAYIVCDFRCFR